MRRREFLSLLGAATFMRPIATRAQQPGRTYRVGALIFAQWDRQDQVAFRDGLRRLGFIEGQNLIIDRAGYGMRVEQFAEHAGELVNSKVDAIFCGGDAAIRAAQLSTTTIPILGIADDMVASGLVRSLPNPGGNTTGVSILSPELDNKRLGLLLELIPNARRIAALADSGSTAPSQLQVLKEAARARGGELTVHLVAKPEEIGPAIDAAKAAGAAALTVLASPLFYANRVVIFERAAALGLPAIYHLPEMARDGGLMAYGPSISRIFGDQMARLMVKLLQGTKPADIAVEQPSKFELVINLRTATALNLTIPPIVLAQADEVIE